MAPVVYFAIGPEGLPIEVEGDIGVKREFGEEEGPKKIHLCIKDQQAVKDLRDLKGEEVIAIFPNDKGIVHERSSGIKVQGEDIYIAPRGQPFEMGSVEIGDGIE